MQSANYYIPDIHKFIKRPKPVGFSEEQPGVFASEHRRIIEVNLVTQGCGNMRLCELEYHLIIKRGGTMTASVAVVAALVKLLKRL